MLTAAQLAANRKSAVNVVRNRLGLDVIAPSAWTFEQRVAYEKALAEFIAAHPAAFDAQDMATARDVSQKDYGALSSPDFSFGDFGGALLDQGAAINDDLNPFSEKNRRVLYWAVFAGVALWALGPVVINLVKQARAK